MEDVWFKLEGFKCPVAGCEGRDGKYTWVCATHNRGMSISQNGNMKCDYILTHSGLICEWKFDCGNHGDHPTEKYKSVDLEGFTFALSQSLQMMKKAGATWVGSLCLSLGKQYGN